MEIRADYGQVSVMILTMVIYGIAYNWLVAWLSRKGYAEGYMSLIVAVGCGITLLGVAMVSLPAALLALVAFMSSGTPMILGSIARYVAQRESEKQAIRDELELRLQRAINGDQSAGMAE